MTRVCFVCLGNICRSAMAEFMMKDWVKKNHLEEKYKIESRGTNVYEGEKMDFRAKEVLKQNHISYEEHIAKQIRKEEENQFDIFLCMEDRHLEYLKRLFQNSSKVEKLLDSNISDPWYHNDFQKTYEEIQEGIERHFSKEEH